jgi:hypothetical protein
LKDLEFKFKSLLWIKLNNEPAEQKNFVTLLNRYNNEFINEIEISIMDDRFKLIVDYHIKLKEAILSHFNVNVATNLLENVKIVNLYENQLSKYKIEEGDLNEEIRSLLYFEGNEQAIQDYLKLHFSSDDNENNKQETNNAVGSLVNASLTKNTKAVLSSYGNSGSSWVHSSSSEKGNKRAGRNAELLVYNTLKNKYGIENVKWVSGNSNTPDKNDKLHYDIRYKNELGIWKYLEVKSITDNQFIISGPEKEKGIAEPDNFEMALVMDKTIYMVKNIFKFNQGESFENNSKFVAHPKDYIFVFDISKLEN